MIWKFRYFLFLGLVILFSVLYFLPKIWSGFSIFQPSNFLANFSGVTLTVTIPGVCGNSIIDAGEQCDNNNFRGANCASLGYNGGTLGCSPSCQYQTSSCISTAYTASTTQMMSFVSGGNFTFTNSNNTNVLFNFPSNFYTENLSLQARSYSPSLFTTEKPAISGKNFIGQAYDFSFVIPSGSSMNNPVSTLSAPVTITMNYSASDISGFNESAIAPYRWGANDSSWQLISGATVDTANKKVTFSTMSFSSFGLFTTPSPAPSPSPSPSPTPSPTPAPSSGGGGGGGGGGIITPSGTSKVLKGDVNSDGRVNLIDFSIAAYWYKRPSPPAKVDLNNDGKVDLIDFSILAFYWTG